MSPSERDALIWLVLLTGRFLSGALRVRTGDEHLLSEPLTSPLGASDSRQSHSPTKHQADTKPAHIHNPRLFIDQFLPQTTNRLYIQVNGTQSNWWWDLNCINCIFIANTPISPLLRSSLAVQRWFSALSSGTPVAPVTGVLTRLLAYICISFSFPFLCNTCQK